MIKLFLHKTSWRKRRWSSTTVFHGDEQNLSGTNEPLLTKNYIMFDGKRWPESKSPLLKFTV